jgi:hypothetical protein
MYSVFAIAKSDGYLVSKDRGRWYLSLLGSYKPKIIQLIFKNSVRTAKKTQLFTITKINWLTLFKEIIPVYSENHTKPISTKCRIADY